MSTEADRFVAAFYRCLERNPDKPPSPTDINRELGKPSGRTPLNVLNGRMSVIRRRLLAENGFEQLGDYFGRWTKKGERK